MLLAWVHFLTCELRPLYFLVFSGASLTQSVENRLKLWGDDNAECFLNKRFHRCASSCSTVWEPKSCACERGAGLGKQWAAKQDGFGTLGRLQ